MQEKSVPRRYLMGVSSIPAEDCDIPDEHEAVAVEDAPADSE